MRGQANLLIYNERTYTIYIDKVDEEQEEKEDMQNITEPSIEVELD